jgi:hypothetical protein
VFFLQKIKEEEKKIKFDFFLNSGNDIVEKKGISKPTK